MHPAALYPAPPRRPYSRRGSGRVFFAAIDRIRGVDLLACGGGYPAQWRQQIAEGGRTLDALLEEGATAPDFCLPDQDGKPVQLADFRGKKRVVLYFYPRAMTSGCTVQAHGVRDHAKDFARLETVVLGLSTDASARLRKFDDKYQLGFPLLSDEDHAVAESYGVWGLKKFMGRESMGVKRISFVIDKKGVVRHVLGKVKTATHAADVLVLLKELSS